MAHKLKIVIEDIQQDLNYIRAVDWSVYDERMSLTNRVMKVEVPGQEDFVLAPFPKNSSTTYSSKSLKLSKNIDALPDGFYVFTYSVCPNERKFVIVNHFRTVDLHNRIMGVVAKLMGCNITQTQTDTLTACLLNVSALKANVIDEYNVQKAYDLYGEAERKFTHLYNQL